MTDELLPPFYVAGVVDVLRQTRGVLNSLNRLDKDERGHPRTITEITPRSAEWLAARAEFAAQWEALTVQGLEQGFLERDACYECGGELQVTTDTEVRRQVPNPEYDATRPNPFLRHGSITIPRARDTRKP